MGPDWHLMPWGWRTKKLLCMWRTLHTDSSSFPLFVHCFPPSPWLPWDMITHRFTWSMHTFSLRTLSSYWTSQIARYSALSKRHCVTLCSSDVCVKYTRWLLHFSFVHWSSSILFNWEAISKIFGQLGSTVDNFAHAVSSFVPNFSLYYGTWDGLRGCSWFFPIYEVIQTSSLHLLRRHARQLPFFIFRWEELCVTGLSSQRTSVDWAE